MQENISTNEVFHHLLLLLRIHKDKQLLDQIFRSAGIEVTGSKIKAWKTKDPSAKDFRPMPAHLLRDFISALHDFELIDGDA